MAEELTVLIPLAMLEDLRCSICKDYLSCSPIRFVPDGSYVCGRCLTLNNNTSYRMVYLEAFLSKMSFPCTYKNQGCQKSIPFNQTVEHERKCAHRSFPCPCRAVTSCSWEGSLLKMCNHFFGQHPDLIKTNAEFKLQVDRDAQGVFAVTKESVLFLIMYKYNSNESLKYDVRYCSDQAEGDVLCRIKLISCSDAECSVNLKTARCHYYDSSFSDMQNVLALDLNKFLGSLDDPSSILVVMNLKTEVPNTVNTNVVSPVTVVHVDHAVLQSLKCKECQNYLIPPLFNLGKTIVCCYCGENKLIKLRLSNEESLLKLVMETNFPCRWLDCNFVGKIDDFKAHDLLCDFRVYKCLISGCTESFKLTKAAVHYQSHGVQYSKEIVYNISFRYEYARKTFFTIKNSTVFLLYHSISRGFTGICHSIFLLLSDPGVLTASVHIEQQNRNLKSKSFELVSNKQLLVGLNQLPYNFKDFSKLTVTVTLPNN